MRRRRPLPRGRRPAADDRLGRGRRGRTRLAAPLPRDHRRATAPTRLRGAYLEAVVRPDEDLARGAYYWHEVIGCAVRGVDGTELGTVKDIYRVGETEVFVGGRRDRRRASTCRPSGRSSGSSRRAAARSSSTPSRSTSRPREGARTAIDPKAPAAPVPEQRPRPPRRVRTPRRARRPARAMTLEIDVLTLFPAMLEGPLAASIPGRIQEQGLADDPRPRPARLGPRPAPLASTTRRTAGERG